MNQIKQVQQLKEDGIPIKEVVRRTGISRKTVRKYLRKIESISLAESTSAVVSDKQLASVVYNSDFTVIRSKRFEALIAHFKQAMEELHNTGVAKQLLWMEYLQDNADGYQYSQYCYLFRKYVKDTDPEGQPIITLV